ncbi:MAG: hypothetical protein BWY67_02458 [Bacteroidetes bacterium ADurb.Bin397]|nr:MAG: hypothetical protein BWY67_02458 [Bacteroidetes bacterium ADurb.Bin397]
MAYIYCVNSISIIQNCIIKNFYNCRGICIKTLYSDGCVVIAISGIGVFQICIVKVISSHSKCTRIAEIFCSDTYLNRLKYIFQKTVSTNITNVWSCKSTWREFIINSTNHIFKTTVDNIEITVLGSDSINGFI